jgi:hypothetical protein
MTTSARATLLAGLFFDDGDKRVLAEAIARCAAWDTLLTLAHEHDVAAAFATTVADQGLGDALPVTVRAHLDDVRTSTTDENTRSLEQLACVRASLSRVGVRALPMLGTALLAAGHVALSSRGVDVLDLWLSKDDMPRAVAHLLRIGCRATRAAGCDRRAALITPAGTIFVLRDEGFGAGGDDAFERAWDEAVGDDVARLPSPQRLLDELSAHVVERHADDARQWARLVVDIARLLSRGADARVGRSSTAQALRVHRGVSDRQASRAARRDAERLVLPLQPPLPLRMATSILEHAGHFAFDETMWRGHARRIWRIVERR